MEKGDFLDLGELSLYQPFASILLLDFFESEEGV
jgi:hypothetical protein